MVSIVGAPGMIGEEGRYEPGKPPEPPEWYPVIPPRLAPEEPPGFESSVEDGTPITESPPESPPPPFPPDLGPTSPPPIPPVPNDRQTPPVPPDTVGPILCTSILAFVDSFYSADERRTDFSLFQKEQLNWGEPVPAGPHMWRVPLLDRNNKRVDCPPDLDKLPPNHIKVTVNGETWALVDVIIVYDETDKIQELAVAMYASPHTYRSSITRKDGKERWIHVCRYKDAENYFFPQYDENGRLSKLVIINYDKTPGHEPGEGRLNALKYTYDLGTGRLVVEYCEATRIPDPLRDGGFVVYSGEAPEDPDEIAYLVPIRKPSFQGFPLSPPVRFEAVCL
jgi:hypothetical protein